MKWAVFLAASGAVVYLCLLILRPFFGVVGWSVVLAITWYPLQHRLVLRNGRVALSAFITSALLVLSVLVPLVVMSGVAVNQWLTLGESLRHALLDPDGTTQRLTAGLTPLAQWLGVDANAIVAWIRDQAREWLAGAAPHPVSAVARVGGGILSFALTTVTTFLLLRHSKTLLTTTYDLLPFPPARSEALLARIRDVVMPACTAW